MRAHLIYETLTHFTEKDSDPITDMGIGYVEVPFAREELKKISISILYDVINRIRKMKSFDEESRVLVNGIEYENLNIFDKNDFLKNLYDAYNYKYFIDRRDNVRALNFKYGDVIKTTIKGKVYIGYVNFSKRGLPVTDAKARLAATTPKGVMKIPIEYIEPVSPKEKKEFSKKYDKYIPLVKDYDDPY